MPDGRIKDPPLDPNEPRPASSHADGTKARAHVGYLRFNLADAVSGYPADPRLPSLDHPQYEVVHLFDREELDFGLGTTTPFSKTQLDIVELHKFAPQLNPVPGLFSSEPPNELLMRTVLSGGELNAPADSDTWYFDDLFVPGHLYQGSFAGMARWTRTVDDEQLTLRIRSFDHREKVTITLRPSSSNTVKLKLANLCAENPLEWEELLIRTLAADEPSDEDFKWFYRLWRHPLSDFGQLTTPLRKLLPHPILDPLGGAVAGGNPPNCECSMTCWNFDTDQAWP